ncbi:MFS transporter [Desulfovibrio cuneatus]|uniref:MFS transporter n=1 Tax=Desulfovibrio cuneatus TaxID=159728 RepID=UPI00040820D6|nr:MFS transporter [Desulfovibrio cuneatus]
MFPERPPCDYSRKLFAMLVVVSMFPYFQQISLSTVMGDVAASLDVSMQDMGWLGMAFSLPYAFMQIPAGMLTDTFGPKRCMVTALVLAALATVWFSFATTFSSALAARMAAGFVISVVFIPSVKLLAMWFSPGSYARVLGWLFTLGSVGYWLPTAPMTYLTALVGWRGSFIVVGILTFACTIMIALGVKERTTEPNLPPTATNSRTKMYQNLTRLLRHGGLWRIGIWYSLTCGAYFSFMGAWGGQYLAQLGLEPTQVGWALTPAAFALATAPFFTWLHEKGLSLQKAMSLLAFMQAATTLPMLFNWLPPSVWVQAVALFLFSTAGIGGAAIAFASARKLSPPGLEATSAGFVNMFPFVGGAVFYQAAGTITHALGLASGPAALLSLTLWLYVGATLVAGLITLRLSIPEEHAPQ